MSGRANGHIVITPGVRFGKPRIARTRITVSDVASMYLEGKRSLEDIADTFDLSLASVFAAMSYYYDHREEIDRRTREGREFAKEFMRKHPSPLQEKLRARKRGRKTQVSSGRAR